MNKYTVIFFSLIICVDVYSDTYEKVIREDEASIFPIISGDYAPGYIFHDANNKYRKLYKAGFYGGHAPKYKSNLWYEGEIWIYKKESIDSILITIDKLEQKNKHDFCYIYQVEFLLDSLHTIEEPEKGGFGLVNLWNIVIPIEYYQDRLIGIAEYGNLLGPGWIGTRGPYILIPKPYFEYLNEIRLRFIGDRFSYFNPKSPITPGTYDNRCTLEAHITLDENKDRYVLPKPIREKIEDAQYLKVEAFKRGERLIPVANYKMNNTTDIVLMIDIDNHTKQAYVASTGNTIGPALNIYRTNVIWRSIIEQKQMSADYAAFERDDSVYMDSEKQMKKAFQQWKERYAELIREAQSKADLAMEPKARTSILNPPTQQEIDEYGGHFRHEVNSGRREIDRELREELRRIRKEQEERLRQQRKDNEDLERFEKYQKTPPA